MDPEHMHGSGFIRAAKLDVTGKAGICGYCMFPLIVTD